MPFLFLLLGAGGVLYGLDQHDKRERELEAFNRERARFQADRDRLDRRLAEIESLVTEHIDIVFFE